jgi:cell division protein FtsQ
MARKGSSTIVQEELYPPADHSGSSGSGLPGSGSSRSGSPAGSASARSEFSRDQIDDARLVDLDVDQESPFLRAQKRVSARHSSLPKKTANRLLWASAAAAVLCCLAVLAGILYNYGERSWRFRVESSDNIDIAGMQNVTKAQIMEVMGADIGRNIFFIPLAQQKAQLEQIPWVESASVMRFVPNRLKVEIQERTPVAFARVGSRISLIDAGGTLMEMPRNHKYSFPVILGMNPGEPLSTRAPRMKAYNQLVRDLDSGGAHYSQDLSEVDLSDLDDLKVRVNDPAGDVLVELGSTDYLKRYKTYVSHVQEWRQQFQKLESVNLSYDNQVIVNPDMEGKPQQAKLTPAVVKMATAAGVKPAALITKIGPHDRAVPKPAFELSQQSLDPKSAAKKPSGKTKGKTSKAKTTPASPAAGAKNIAAKNAAAKNTGGRNTGAKKQPGSASVARKSNTTAQPAARKPAQSTAQAVTPAASSPKPSPAIAKTQGSTTAN